ncbi:MAG: ABC transporter permease [Acidimicrobiales bacterium]|nr:ABC transporter permease [Acidimicrobiales bacterium]MYG89726.1 ABC transporter permease [Acidimicrobiales bacterium]MYI27193.1 ABC transporter permease [Acidimicrobiales bacterium]
MLRLGIKSLLAHKVRFALTASTIVIGVAFVVAAFVTADSLRSGFDQLAEDINTGTDYTVRGELPFGEITEAVAPAVPADLVDDIAAVDGVEIAKGGLFVDGVIPVDGSGEAVTTFGPPVAGTNWLEDESLSQFYLMEGRWPVGGGEFAIDITTFEDDGYDFELGGTYQVVTPTGPREFTLTGAAQFGFPENAGVGAIFSLFDTETAQEVLGYPGEFTVISVRAEAGADIAELQTRIEAVLPDGVEVITAADSEEEFSDATETFIGPFQTILLVFAFIVLFVSMFIISNTFNIVLGQRVRELSLLRAVGATPQQVRRSVLTESAIIGIVASVAGLGLGMLGALGIKALFNALGASLPEGSLPLTLRTVLWAVAVGVGFTVLASLVPAIKASRISPVAGLSEGTTSDERASLGWKRLASGGVLLAIGLVLTGLGLFGDFDGATPQLSTLGAGAAITFVAVSVLSPLVARSVVSLLARPLVWIMPISGRLARANAARNPRRTSATAVALTIGLALVTMVSIVGQSLKVSFGNRLATAFTADFIVTVDTQAGLPKTLSTDIRAAGIGTPVGFDFDLVQIETSSTEAQTTVVQTTLTAARVSDLDAVINIDVVEGSLDGFDPQRGLLIHSDVAGDEGLALGDQVDLTFVSGDRVTVNVTAIFEGSGFWSNWFIDSALHSQVATTAFDDILMVQSAIDDPEAARAAIDEVLTAYPQAVLEDRQEFQESIESNLNTVLVLVNVFLGFALLIALVGIVNTLTLSVFERIREIGLLRAVGMTRRQMRRMIRWEAAAVSLYGAVVGVVLGGAFGLATSAAIPEDIIDTISIPAAQLVFFLVISVAFGLIAALFPAFRASRMNVLDAIADE